MIAINDIYVDVCDYLLEPGGLQLELLTNDQFIQFCRSVLIDFIEKTSLIEDAFTNVPAYFSEKTVEYPDEMLHLHEVFWDNQYLRKNDAFGIDHSEAAWEYQINEPAQWHEDRMADRTFAVFPAPSAEGTFYTLFGTKNIVPDLTLDSIIEDIPSSFSFYMFCGVMAKVHSMDGELKDDFKAQYFWNRYQECLQLTAAITREALPNG